MASKRPETPFSRFHPNSPVMTTMEVGIPNSVHDGIEMIAEEVRSKDQRHGRYEFVHEGVQVRVTLTDKEMRHRFPIDEY